jgi:hypothetical protein
MSSESMNRPEDMSVARAMLESSEVLKNDAYARRVLENGGVTDNGSRPDIGDFLAAREAVLMNDEMRLKEMTTATPEALREAMVVHSEDPTYEQK